MCSCSRSGEVLMSKLILPRDLALLMPLGAVLECGSGGTVPLSLSSPIVKYAMRWSLDLQQRSGSLFTATQSLQSLEVHAFGLANANFTFFFVFSRLSCRVWCSCMGLFKFNASS